MHAALELRAFEQPLVIPGTIGRIGVDGGVAVSLIEELLAALGVVHVGGK